jgi:hypothetical protein
MYDAPQRICVCGLVRQSAPAEAIFSPGNDCGIPVALDEGLTARWFQPDSRVHSCSRANHWSSPQPYVFRM